MKCQVLDKLLPLTWAEGLSHSVAHTIVRL
jgi:hypothetical protein